MQAGAEPVGERQSAFRVRRDFSRELDADAGWAAGVDEAATVQADTPFRLRVELEHGGGASARRYGLQVRRNDGDWEPLGAENFPQPAKELELDFGAQLADESAARWDVVDDSGGGVSGRAEGEEGHARFGDAAAPVLALARYDTHWEPVEFAADVRLPEGGSGKVGLVFGYADTGNYQRVDLRVGGGVDLVAVRDGEPQVLASEAFDVPVDEWAELKVVLRGPEITVEYDDEAVVLRHRLDGAVTPQVGVFTAAGGVLDVASIAIEGMPRSPRVSIMEARSFAHGDATTDVLPVSERPFAGGAGISFADRTPPLTAGAGQSEWEFPLVIRRFSDGARVNETGDRFAFRVVDDSGRVLPAAETAAVTLEVPERHLGGTFVETPMRIGPWQAQTGDLYFLMEPAETDNMLMAVKSADGGGSWAEMDGDHRPATGDLEGFASVLVGDRIHMLHQTSEHVFYHVFRTADHAEQPDTWAIRDERLASPEEPPTQVADLAVRSDGSVVAVYGGPEKIHTRTRSPDGEWSGEAVIDADRGPHLSGPSLALGADDVVHLAYTGDDGTAWYRRLQPDGTLTPRVQVASGLGTGSEDVGSVLPLVRLSASDTVSIIVRRADGHLWVRRIAPDGDVTEPVQVSARRVAQNPVDSDQTGADAIGWGDSVHVLFIEAESGHLFHIRRQADGDWQEAERLVDDAAVQWVRGAVVDTADGPVYGYVYDAGSDGGSGMNRYGEVALTAPDE
ncbi:hypothetical protein [Algiphilus sp.]|uniref:hypothetical protein n=1 Tax=Algiphilus sp. TaxID=1872431 RepID=UPI0025C258E3|nr:hypothetical protein [Algiphilus sp.]MCK5772120.1 hypothetical protein [Algiphilus sp.]